MQSPIPGIKPKSLISEQSQLQSQKTTRPKNINMETTMNAQHTHRPTRLLCLAVPLVLFAVLIRSAPAQRVTEIQLKYEDGTRQTLAIPPHEAATTTPATAPATQAIATPPFRADISPAGLATFFNGLACLPENERTAYRWLWNFGDASAGSPTAGFNAAHVYEKPGTYTVTLTLTPNTQSPAPSTPPLAPSPLHLSMSIVVLPSRMRTVQVAAGSDLSQFTGSVGLELILAPGNYTAVRGLKLTGCIIRGAGATLNIRPGADGMTLGSGCRVDGLTFDYPALAHPTTSRYDGVGMCIYPSGRGIAVTNCVFLNVGYGVNGNKRPDNVLIENCSAPLIDGLRAYLAWVEGGAWCIYNNAVANCTIEHCVRCEGDAGPLAIIGNHLDNLGQADSGVKGDAPKGSIVLHASHDCYVAANTVRTSGIDGGGIGAGPLTQYLARGDRTVRIVIEDNHLIDAPIRISAGSSDVAIRGNTTTVQNPAYGNTGIYMDARAAPVVNVRITDNTMTAPPNGQFITGLGTIEDIRINDNTFTPGKNRLGDYGNAGITLPDGALTACGGNVWNKPPGGMWQGYHLIGGKWYRPQDWKKLYPTDRFDW
jgi:hypothetical protein